MSDYAKPSTIISGYNASYFKANDIDSKFITQTLARKLFVNKTTVNILTGSVNFQDSVETNQLSLTGPLQNNGNILIQGKIKGIVESSAIINTGICNNNGNINAGNIICQKIKGNVEASDIINSGNFTNSGSILSLGDLECSSTIKGIVESSDITNTGTFINTGAITSSGNIICQNTVKGNIESTNLLATGNITNNGIINTLGNIVCQNTIKGKIESSSLTNTGTFINTGAINASGNIICQNTVKGNIESTNLLVTGTITNDGNINTSGNIDCSTKIRTNTLESNSITTTHLTNSNIITASGNIECLNTIKGNIISSNLTNSGTFTNTGNINTSGNINGNIVCEFFNTSNLTINNTMTLLTNNLELTGNLIGTGNLNSKTIIVNNTQILTYTGDLDSPIETTSLSTDLSNTLTIELINSPRMGIIIGQFLIKKKSDGKLINSFCFTASLNFNTGVQGPNGSFPSELSTLFYYAFLTGYPYPLRMTIKAQCDYITINSTNNKVNLIFKGNRFFNYLFSTGTTLIAEAIDPLGDLLNLSENEKAFAISITNGIYTRESLMTAFQDKIKEIYIFQVLGIPVKSYKDFTVSSFQNKVRIGDMGTNTNLLVSAIENATWVSFRTQTGQVIMNPPNNFANILGFTCMEDKSSTFPRILTATNTLQPYPFTQTTLHYNFTIFSSI